MLTALGQTMKRSGAVLIAVAVLIIYAPQILAAELTFGEIANAVVRVEATIKPGARTARTLGLERTGSGVVIDDNGLVLTIGYLIMESETVRLTTRAGKSTAADVVAYDHRSGFGLVRARGELELKPLALGSSADLQQGTPLLILSMGTMGGVTPVRVGSRRPFAGPWEYLLDNAIYTFPPHREFGGAALVDLHGSLLGVGSLFVGNATDPDSETPGNMFVPIDLLKPILAKMVKTGKSGQVPRPWIGVYAAVSEGRVFVNRLASDGPGAEAGLKTGDIIVGVRGRRVGDLADLFRKVWAEGAAGTDVTLDILPLGSPNLEIKKVVIRSKNRHQWLQLGRD